MPNYKITSPSSSRSCDRHRHNLDIGIMVRREPAPHARLGGETPQLGAHARLGPWPPAGRAFDDAEQRTERELEPLRDPRAQVLPTPVVHPDLTSAAALATADK